MTFEHKAVEPIKGSVLAAGGKTRDKEIEVTVFLGYPENVLKTVPEISSKNVEDRRHWNREELRDESNIEDFTNVNKWADENNLITFDSNIGARTVKVKGATKDVEKAFDIKFKDYTVKDGPNYRTFVGTVKLPSFIHSVHGLDTRPIAKRHSSSANVKSVDVSKAYQFPSGTGSGQTVGIIELGGGFTSADLTSYWQLMGVTGPKVTAVGIDGAGNQPGGSADIEVDLDVEIPGSIATGANYVVYFAPNTDQGFVDAITTAAHDTTNKPSIISISWGGPEKSWPQSSIAAMNQAFQACAALGITVFAASGDNGNTDGAPGLNVDYPASDPYVTGCGGTDITSLSPLTENGWQYAGGGASAVFSLPTYQQSTAGGKTTRGVPDVAGLAGSPGFTIVSQGRTGGAEGTSCVAPLWAGLIAIINSSIGKNVGFLNPIIYRNQKAFNDITTGNNGFAAGPGWDPVTGLGTPIGTALLTALQGTIQPPNTLSVPNSLSYHLKENTAASITLTATDTVSGVTSILYGVITPPTNGTLISGTFTGTAMTYSYNPTTGFAGTDSFTYQATDNIGTKSNIGVVNLTIAQTVIPQTRYQLRSTQRKGEPVPDPSWKNLFDSGVLS